MAKPDLDHVAAAATPALRSEVETLRGAVNFMDALAQGGFSAISAVAQLALAQLETPDGYRHLDNLVYALCVIRDKADDIQNCINCEAEQVGCNYVDDAQRRRWAAQRAHREQETAHPRPLTTRSDATLGAHATGD